MKKLLLILLALGVIAALALGAVSWWIMRNMGPEIWITQMESAWNCRAHIDDAQLSLFTRPASLTFKGVRLAPRDAEVARALAARTPMAKDAAVITVPEVVLQVHLDDLLNRRLNIQRLSLVNPVVREMLDAKGDSSLGEIFRRPEDVDALHASSTPSQPVPPRYNERPPGQPTPPPVPKAVPAATTPASAAQGADDEDSSAFRFSYAVKEARIEGGQLHIDSGSTQVDITGLDFTLTDIDLDPADLERHNRMHAALAARIVVMGMARVGGAKQPAQLADLRLTGEGDIMPIDPKTREWSPSTLIKLKLARDSVLAGHMTMGDAAGKDLGKLAEYGIDLSGLRVGGPLMEDAVIDGLFAANRLTLRSLTRFVFQDYEVAIEKSSWINGAQDQHSMRLRLSCGAELQQRLEGGIAAKKLGDSLARGITKALSDERGRLTFDISTSGRLSDPDVKLSVERILGNLLRGQGLGDLLQGLLKKL